MCCDVTCHDVLCCAEPAVHAMPVDARAAHRQCLSCQNRNQAEVSRLHVVQNGAAACVQCKVKPEQGGGSEGLSGALRAQ